MLLLLLLSFDRFELFGFLVDDSSSLVPDDTKDDWDIRRMGSSNSWVSRFSPLGLDFFDRDFFDSTAASLVGLDLDVDLDLDDLDLDLDLVGRGFLGSSTTSSLELEVVLSFDTGLAGRGFFDSCFNNALLGVGGASRGRVGM